MGRHAMFFLYFDLTIVFVFEGKTQYWPNKLETTVPTTTRNMDYGFPCMYRSTCLYV